MIIIIILGGLYLYGLYYMIRQLLNSPKVKGSSFNYVFGVPGSGKTTCLSYIASKIQKINNSKRAIKKGRHYNIYSNIDLVGIDYIKITKEDIGYKNMHDGVLLFDEAGIDFNNRSYKNMSPKAIQFLKLHRHYNLTIYIFSQDYEDSDITLRRLATNYYQVYKCILFKLRKKIILRGIKKVLFIKKDDKQIISGYEYRFIGKFVINSRKLFKYFNSFDRYLELEDFKV